MKLFPEDLDIVLYETAFEDDLLDRRPLSKQLSELVEKLENPTVLALDDRWGTGKTYFLKRWVAAHTKENEGKATTDYFDAFEFDYLSDPLVSIISSVNERYPETATATLDRWKSAAKKLVKPGIGIALSLATLGAKQHLDEAGDVIAEAVGGKASEFASDLWEAEQAKKEALTAFKTHLRELTDESGAPLVIVVDELDRCRPDFALSILEIVKHLFAVSNVHFILGVNGSALENSVKARYGAEIDAEAYLRKFINASFSLPKVKDRLNKISYTTVFARQVGEQMELPSKILDRVVELLRKVDGSNDVSLRDISKILSRIALVPAEVSEKNFLPGWIDVLAALLVSSQVAPEFHNRFVNGNVTTDEIADFLGATDERLTESTAENPNPHFDSQLSAWFALLVWCIKPSEFGTHRFLSEEWQGYISRSIHDFGWRGDTGEVVRMVQRDWVDLFKLNT